MRQKNMLWFNKGQEFQFLSCHLSTVRPNHKTVLQI